MDGLAPALPPPEARVLRALLVLVALAAGVAGGWVLWERTDDEEPAPAPEAAGWNTCVNPVVGFAIDYPALWHTDHPAPEFACTYFDPRRFELAPREDWEPKALVISPVDDFDAALADWTDEASREVRDREDVELDAGSAVRLETVTRSGPDEGRVTYLYLVDHEPQSLVVWTSGTPGADFEPWKVVVDRAVRSIRFTRRGPPVVEGAGVVPPQRGLPEPVARKREAIWKAARAEDYASLAALAARDGFQYTFGGPVQGGPAAYWRRLEQTTRERPLSTLAAILELPYAYQQEAGIYVWPDAFTRKAGALSLEEKERLADAIGEDAVKVYEQLGDYLGYRAGIDAEGDWVFYVAGD